MAKLYKIIEENEFVSLLLNTTNTISLKGATALYKYFVNKPTKYVEVDMMYIASTYIEYKNWQDFRNLHPTYRNMDELKNDYDVIFWSEKPVADGFIVAI